MNVTNDDDEISLENWLFVNSPSQQSSGADGLASLPPPENSHGHQNLTSFDMFDSCTVRNVKRVIRINKTLKPLRLHLLKQVLDLCHQANIEPFVYGGTALSVFRESGHMIPHDTDIDLAVLEYHSTTNEGAFGKLGSYCLDNAISVVGIKNIGQTVCNSTIHVNLEGSINKTIWLEKDTQTGSISEKPYNGSDCKRAKFYFTPFGLRQACDKIGFKHKHIQNILSDPGLVHVDLFTLSKHPENPDSYLRVNWNLPFVYDCNRKQFPISAIIPLRECVFEEISLMAPADLQVYLTVEYGYLGRNAQYDQQKQLYVPIPDKFISYLPDHMKMDTMHCNNKCPEISGLDAKSM